jgi:hypothetical protein
MWIAKIALQRPYTFGVLALLILPPDDMPTRIVLLTEKTAQTDISNVEHTESRSLVTTSHQNLKAALRVWTGACTDAIRACRVRK